jgi:hypothetical protein
MQRGCLAAPCSERGRQAKEHVQLLVERLDALDRERDPLRTVSGDRGREPAMSCAYQRSISSGLILSMRREPSVGSR